MFLDELVRPSVEINGATMVEPELRTQLRRAITWLDSAAAESGDCGVRPSSSFALGGGVQVTTAAETSTTTTKGSVYPNKASFTVLALALSRAGNFKGVLVLHDLMVAVEHLYPEFQPDTLLLGQVIHAQAKLKLWQGALATHRDMVSRGLKPNQITYGSVIMACAKASNWGMAVELLHEMRELGIEPNQRIYSAAITACHDSGEWVVAKALVEDMKMVPNVYVYTAAIGACVRSAQVPWARQLFKEMLENGIAPNRVTYNEMIRVMSGVIGPQPTVVGVAEEDRDRGEQRAAAWGWADIEELLCAMQTGLVGGREAHDPMAPDSYTFANLLQGCAKIGAATKAVAFLDDMLAGGMPVREQHTRPAMQAISIAGDTLAALEFVRMFSKAEVLGVPFAVPTVLPLLRGLVESCRDPDAAAEVRHTCAVYSCVWLLCSGLPWDVSCHRCHVCVRA